MAPRKTPGGGPKPDKLMRDALALELHQEVELTTGESGAGGKKSKDFFVVFYTRGSLRAAFKIAVRA